MHAAAREFFARLIARPQVMGMSAEQARSAEVLGLKVVDEAMRLKAGDELDTDKILPRAAQPEQVATFLSSVMPLLSLALGLFTVETSHAAQADTKITVGAAAQAGNGHHGDHQAGPQANRVIYRRTSTQ